MFKIVIKVSTGLGNQEILKQGFGPKMYAENLGTL